MKLIVLCLIVSLSFSCTSQKSSQQNKIDFREITFHSSPCNGSCPDISMNIKKDRTIQLTRTIFIGKGTADITKSGGFKGELDKTKYDSLVLLLNEIDWEKVVFPNVTCCDRPVKTIILSYSGEVKRFKSMTPPEDTEKLMAFLTELGTMVTLPAHSQPIDFEVVPD